MWNSSCPCPAMHKNLPSNNLLFNWTPILLFKNMMGPGTGLHSSRPCPDIHKDLPSNGLLHTEFQVTSLNSHKHEGNHVVTESIGSHFNETRTPLSMPLHFCRTDINTTCVHQLTTPWSSLSKRINRGVPLRLARYCWLNMISTSALRCISGSRPSSCNFIMTLRLNWSYFVKTAITGTWKCHVVMSISIHRVAFQHRHTTLVWANCLKIL